MSIIKICTDNSSIAILNGIAYTLELFFTFFPKTLYNNPDNIPGTIFIVLTMFVAYIVVLRYLESET